MGACESSDSKETREAQMISRRIDKELEKKSNGNMEQKLLLLGPGESGKSTCLKQMKIMHTSGYTEQEIQEKKLVVYINIIQSMMALLDAMESFAIPFESSSMEIHCNLIKKVFDSGSDVTEFSSDLRTAVRELWADKGVRECFSQRSRFHISESAE
uniref:Guanine nucleotide-binding protein G(Q) subunit alpha n=1 Tax=Heterorhabditis bacteriophora TaxID=37862 RepID=A0A1I7WCQ2_HETBA